MRQAMIFAAGLGTRLKPLTDTMPKALVRVGGEPLLWHVIMRLRAAGFGRLVINVHHFADQIVAYLEANGFFGLDTQVSDERACLLETGGGIRHALPLLDANAPVLIHNVDILSNIDLAAFYEAAEPHSDALLLVSQRTTKRYLLFDQERLVGWTNVETGEVRTPHIHIPDGAEKLAFSGVHLLMPSMFPLLKEEPDRFPIIDFYLRRCAEKRIMAHVGHDLQLLDVGKLDTLEKAEQFLKEFPT